MRVFAEATRAIQQGASRRGANMGMMSVEHPDILKFVVAKTEAGALANFNLSVKMTDAFMARLQTEPGAPHVVTNPRTGQGYVIPRKVDPADYVVQDLLPAGQGNRPCYTVSDVWESVVACAYATGEPGICFIDRVNRANPTPALGRIEATNPCGEQPLLQYESCNLGSINLARFVDAQGRTVRWDELATAIRLAVRFLDDVVDANHYPLPEIRSVTLGNRKVGLGIMGFADALVLLGIRYGTEEAVWFAEAIVRFLAEQARHASERLARSRGCFPNWPGSLWDRGCRASCGTPRARP
jgi:ribonucleoside-diphosphate reductase alpha chain